MYKLKFFAILFLAIAIVGCGNGIIRGKIVDETGDPVLNAQITTEPPTFSNLSTSEGYEIKNIPAGIYTVKATKSGYTTKTVEVNVYKKRVTRADIQVIKSKK